jgi:hypothetical protein
MKKVFLSVAAILAFGFANAQEKASEGQTAKGKILVEANTGFGSGVGSTQIGFSSRSESGSSYNFGVEGGYFVMNNLAVKLGLGYGGVSPKVGDAFSAFSYKLGAKYYVINTIPLELSLNGTSLSKKSEGFKDPMYIGIQGGYAIFIADNVSIEPGLRYNYSLTKKEEGGENVLQFNVGFALHF